MIRKILNPDLYHGHGKKKDFFEGWYFKISDSKKENTLAFIPGIFLGKDEDNSHSFIQIVDGISTQYDYLRFKTTEFKASKEAFDIKLDKNRFSLDGFSLDIADSSVNIKGKINFSNVKKWPDTFINPGSMGFYNYLTFMQCYSQVCAMDIELSGSLNINGEDISFENGRGYIEKNWGKDFPYSWIWVQGNQFDKRKAALSCSIGHVPFPLGSFKGFLIGFMIEGDFYTFTTMNRSKIKIKRIEDDVEIRVKNSHHLLKMKVSTKPDTYMTLLGPRNDKMIPIVKETLRGLVEVELIEIKGNKTIFKDISHCAGVEYGGDQALVLNEKL